MIFELMFQIEPSNLGMSKEYFLRPTNLKFLESYRNYMFEISILLGAPPDIATREVEEIICFEKNLAMVT